MELLTLLAILLSCNARAAVIARGVSRGWAARDSRNVLSCKLGRNGSTIHECAIVLSFCATFLFPRAAAIGMFCGLEKESRSRIAGCSDHKGPGNCLSFRTPTLDRLGWSDRDPQDYPQLQIAEILDSTSPDKLQAFAHGAEHSWEPTDISIIKNQSLTYRHSLSLIYPT